MQCVNKNLREYQTLKRESGLSDSELSHLVGAFLDTVGRYPYLDELEGSNSEPAIKEDLKLNKDNVTTVNNILKATNTSNIDDAIQVLNNKYRDKEIEISVAGNSVKVYVTDRPTMNSKGELEYNDSDINNFKYFNDIIDKLNTLYGINVIPITNKELKDSDLGKIAGTAKAFIYNGDIYVNVDIATVDSPVHEFLHMLFGSMKYSNRDLYNNIVSQAELFETYKEISLEYPNRTREDVNEEVFVTELAKYLSGRPSVISKLPLNIQHEIFYNINRTLDTILMGDFSVRCIPELDLYQMNFKTLSQIVLSSNVNNFQTTLNNAMLSRIMSNKKLELMNEGLLKEECL